VELYLYFSCMPSWCAGASDNFTYYPILIPSKAHTASYSTGKSIFFSPEYGGEGVTLPYDLHLLARLKTRGALPTLLHASFSGAWLTLILIMWRI